jgi:hypothetical protein
MITIVKQEMTNIVKQIGGKALMLFISAPRVAVTTKFDDLKFYFTSVTVGTRYALHSECFSKVLDMSENP